MSAVRVEFSETGFTEPVNEEGPAAFMRSGKKTLEGVIEQFEALRGSKYGQEIAVGWLSELDHKIKTELMDTHEGFEDVVFDGYDEQTKLTTKLLIQGTYADIYLKWLLCRVDYFNAEATRYNSAMAAFNYAWVDLANWINRTHRPRQGAGIKRLV